MVADDQETLVARGDPADLQYRVLCFFRSQLNKTDGLRKTYFTCQCQAAATVTLHSTCLGQLKVEQEIVQTHKIANAPHGFIRY
jgi:hypothetical protein